MEGSKVVHWAGSMALLTAETMAETMAPMKALKKDQADSALG